MAKGLVIMRKGIEGWAIYLSHARKDPGVRILISIKSRTEVDFGGEVIGGESSNERKGWVRRSGREVREV